MRKKMKLHSDGGNSGSNKYKRGYGGSYGGVWRCPDVGGLFCVGAFGRNLGSVTVKMFSPLIYFIKKFCKCCTFNAIRKDNAAINCNTVQHKKFYSQQI
jgi:hypothetical protein